MSGQRVLSHALVVDDEPDIRELLEMTLARMNVGTTAVEALASARRAVLERDYDLCLADMRLPDGDGIELVRFMQRHRPTVPVAIITAHGNMESAVEALKAGAFDFVSKPVDLQVLRNLIDTALKLGRRAGRPARALIGDSDPMQAVRAMIAKLARSQAPVHISGESGTGKELVARTIHEQGPRAEAPFVPVNCGAIPAELMESEFFGHKKGSFTGAVADKPGLFQAAEGGTLFLDEVADLPLHMQVKLLRAIQERSTRPVGAQREVAMNVRILSASHRDLPELVRKGQFRQDLYYRLHVIEVRVPALRERPEDIPAHAENILARLAAEMGIAEPHLSRGALQALRGYSFPGNVRELENILERAVTLAEGNTIAAEDLGLDAPAGATLAVAGPEAQPAGEGSAPATSPEASNGGGVTPVRRLEELEKETILCALEQTAWNKTAAARLLGINFGALRYRLRKFGLE